MADKERKGLHQKIAPRDVSLKGRCIGAAVTLAMNRGFVVGREVLLGTVPGIVVGYNIASFGQFIGSAYPLVVRTALGVTKCGLEEVSLV